MERLGVLALRAAAVWQCSTLVQPPGGAVQSEHSCRVELWQPTQKQTNNKKTLYQRKSSSANNHLCIFFLLLFFWNDACVLKCRPRSLICVAKSQFYIQRFQIPEGHLQRQVQPPCDHPISGEAQGRKGFFIRAKKGGIVPISSGKRATVGINRSVLGNKSQGMMDQDLGMSKAGGEGDCKVATFILGAEGWGHQIS